MKDRPYFIGTSKTDELTIYLPDGTGVGLGVNRTAVAEIIERRRKIKDDAGKSGVLGEEVLQNLAVVGRKKISSGHYVPDDEGAIGGRRSKHGLDFFLVAHRFLRLGEVTSFARHLVQRRAK